MTWLQGKMINPKDLAQVNMHAVETAHDEARNMAKDHAIDKLKSRNGQAEGKKAKSEARRLSTENGPTASELGRETPSPRGPKRGVLDTAVTQPSKSTRGQILQSVSTQSDDGRCRHIYTGEKAIPQPSSRWGSRGILGTRRSTTSAEMDLDPGRESKHLAGNGDREVKGDLVFLSDAVSAKAELEPLHHSKEEFSSGKPIYPVISLSTTARFLRTPRTPAQDLNKSLYYRVAREDTSHRAGALARTLDLDNARIFSNETSTQLFPRSERTQSGGSSDGSSSWEERVLNPRSLGPGMPKNLAEGNRSAPRRIFEGLRFAPGRNSTIGGSESVDSRPNLEIRADVGFTDSQNVFVPHSPAPPQLLSPLSNQQQRRDSFARARPTSTDTLGATARMRSPIPPMLPTYGTTQTQRAPLMFGITPRQASTSDLPMYSHIPIRRVSAGVPPKYTTSSSGSSG
eukprot:CAMPEP_0184300048 /NCGR_PEP_ID=MMETSP1049-20130417/10549_1 /TAXON_ID=77928 /ORGANISM="Proteomonas sulcata, Strain CCMP704" /LENGTH=456 /DNA_ID=CAMNT_0026610673 /DNA_START=51 /DNA_END=1421 /DNA_ORIENTATION=+